MFLKKYTQLIFFIFISFILAIFAVNHWFENNSLIYYWDSFILLDIKKTWGYIYYSWSNSIFPGSAPLGGWSLIPYWLIVSSVHKITGSISFAEEFLYAGLMFTSLLSFYLLMSHIAEIVFGEIKKKFLLMVGNFVFAILYTFNLYTFYYAYFMFNPDVFILALLPLNILALLKIYPLKEKIREVKKDLRWIALFFLTLFAMTSGFATYVFLMQYLIWLLIYLLLYILISRTKLISLKTLSLLLFFILIILSQWWWFFSALLTFEKRYAVEAQVGTTVWFDAGLIQSWLLNTIRLLGVTLSLSNIFSWSKYYENTWFTLPLFIFPFLIIFLLVKARKLKSKILIAYLLLIFTVSLFIVKFSNPPFAFITKFAFYYIPFFGAFRGAYHKAGLFYLFTYFILSGIGFYYINRWFIKTNKRLRIFSVFFLLGIATIVVTGPFFLFYKDNNIKLRYEFDNKDYAFVSKTRVPPEYYELKSFFSPICPGKTTVIIPRGGWISSADWPKYGTNYAGIDMIAQLINCEFMTTVVFIPKPEVSNQGFFFLMDNGDYKGVRNFLYQNQIGYLLIRKDHIPYSPTSWVYVNPERVKDELKKDKDFKKIYENDLLFVYEFGPLKKMKNYGFALSNSAIYTDSQLTKYMDFANLARHYSESIGKMIINTKDGFNKYMSYIDTYIIQAACRNCADKQQNEEQKTVRRELKITENGTYLCRADTFDPETKIDNVVIKNKDENIIGPISSGQIQLSRGEYSVDINYTVKHVFDNPRVELTNESLIEISLGKISQGDYNLTYNVDNREFGIEGFLTKDSLSPQDLKRRPYGREGDGVLFTDPVPKSKKISNVDRIFTANEFTNYNYTLYFNSEKKPGSGKAKISDIKINKVVKGDLITYSCSKNISVINDKKTPNLKVEQRNPTLYTVLFSQEYNNGFLTFNKSFDKNWIAYSDINGKKHKFDHIESGYANAWFIDSPTDNVTIEYTRQGMIEKNALIWIIIFPAIVVLYLKIINLKAVKKNKK